MGFILPVIIIALFAMMVMQMLRQRKQMKQVEELQSKVQPGDRIMTTAGLHATVVATSAATVDLEIAPGVVTTWDRRIIRELLEGPSATDAIAEDTVGDTAADETDLDSAADSDGQTP